MARDADRVDRPLPQEELALVLKLVADVVEDVQPVVVCAAEHSRGGGRASDRVHQNRARRRCRLREPLAPLGCQAREPYHAVVAHERDIAVLGDRDLVEAGVPARARVGSDLRCAFAGLGVPRHDRAVERAGEDLPSVRRPVERALPERRPRLELHALRQAHGVPHDHPLVVRGREDVAGSRRDRHLLDARRVGVDLSDSPAGVDVEDADDAVVAAEHRPSMQGVDGARIRLRLEGAPDLHLTARLEIPYAERHVVAGGEQLPLVVADRQHVLLVALEDIDDRAGPQIPDEHAPVTRHRRAVALVDEHEILDIVRMPAKDELRTSIRKIPDDGRVVGGRRRSPSAAFVDDDAVDQMPVKPEQLDAPAHEVVDRDCAVVARRHDVIASRDARRARHRPAMPDEPVDADLNGHGSLLPRSGSRRHSLPAGRARRKQLRGARPDTRPPGRR